MTNDVTFQNVCAYCRKGYSDAPTGDEIIISAHPTVFCGIDCYLKAIKLIQRAGALQARMHEQIEKRGQFYSDERAWEEVKATIERGRNVKAGEWLVELERGRKL